MVTVLLEVGGDLGATGLNVRDDERVVIVGPGGLKGTVREVESVGDAFRLADHVGGLGPVRKRDVAANGRFYRSRC